ncbi:ATP synthase subunit b, mitochondrial-like [Daphnia pulicaria]|uniref:ATP synthase subunit b, mitochondrial-like n=1 Tax=Daphnia pulicaria TaxID=35523 RepID=UPI001EEC0DC7|nr:ATP synthase subunit b, mitochondrial-like [Daphnia pulicaria]
MRRGFDWPFKNGCDSHQIDLFVTIRHSFRPRGHLKAAAAATTKCPERDVVNFPRPVRQVYPGKVHMGFIPCIGPYTFRLCLATYLCSKEIYIMEREFYAGLSIAIMGVYAVKKLGSGHSQIWPLKKPKARIAAEKVEQDRALAMKMLFDAVKRENVALQLEAAYRQQLRNPRNRFSAGQPAAITENCGESDCCDGNQVICQPYISPSLS